MTKTAKAPVRCGLSGTALKYIACITMLIDHIGASCIEAGILLDRYELVSLTCGNLSVRMPTGEILVTPSGQHPAGGRPCAAVYRAAGLSHLLLSGRGGLSAHPRCKKIRPAASAVRPSERGAF